MSTRPAVGLPDRVLLVSDSYPPLTGGATLATEQLARELAAAGTEVTVATAWQEGVPAISAEPNVTVHRLRGLVSRVGVLRSDPTRYTPPPFPDPELVWRLRRLIKASRPQLIHTYGWLSYSVTAAVWPRRVPILMSHRDYSMICPKRTLVRDGRACSGPSWSTCLPCSTPQYGRVRAAVSTVGVLGQRRLVRASVDAWHSCSDYVRELVGRELGLDARAPHVVLPDFRPDDGGSSAGQLDTVAAELAGLPDEPFILYVGALRLVKGVDVLLSAYAQLDDPPPLVLIGSPAPDTPPLPAGVIVLPAVSHPAVLAAWDRALFGVAPSRLPEPLGNVVHEAMSRAKPVIGSRVGGHGQMITDGRDGYLIEPGRPDDLAAAMRRLIDDPALRARLGAAAARTSGPRFSRAVVAPQFLELYARTWGWGPRPALAVIHR